MEGEGGVAGLAPKANRNPAGEFEPGLDAEAGFGRMSR